MSFVHPLEWPMKFGTWKCLSIQILRILKLNSIIFWGIKTNVPMLLVNLSIYSVCIWFFVVGGCWRTTAFQGSIVETTPQPPCGEKKLATADPTVSCQKKNHSIDVVWSMSHTHDLKLPQLATIWMILHEIRKPICNWLNNLLVPSILSTISRWTYTNSQL